MDSVSPTPPNQPAPPRRVVARTFAEQEDAARALAAMLEADITAELRAHTAISVRDGRPETRGYSLLVDPAASKDAARLLLKMPPSEAAAARPSHATASTTAKLGRRLSGRRATPPQRQRSALWLIMLAIACAAGAIIFGLQAIAHFQQKRRTPAAGAPLILTTTEDLNSDGQADLERTIDGKGTITEIRQDLDCDGNFDIRWLWERGSLTTRDRDVDDDGRWDERTTYDPDGQFFFQDLRPGAKGSVAERRVYRDGLLWRTLVDKDRDLNFDHVRELDEAGAVTRDALLAPHAPENARPQYPLEPLPATTP